MNIDVDHVYKRCLFRVVAGSRIGLTWARPRNHGGRPMRYRNSSANIFIFIDRSRLGSPSPSHRRGYRENYNSRRNDDRYYKRRYSR